MSNQATFEVPTFETVGTLRSAIEGDVPADLYPRDGTRQLYELEDRFAELARVDEGGLVLCASGMAAVTGAVNSVLTRESVLAFPATAYSRTHGYAEWLRKTGFKVTIFDSGDPEDVERVIATHRPDIVFSETVGNGIDTPVLDVKALYETCDTVDVRPTIILDNTLPLSTGLDLIGTTDPDRKLLVVESATKSYAFNKELAGLIYSSDRALVDAARSRRQIDGFGPNVSAVQTLTDVIPKSLKAFDERNIQVFTNSQVLAQAALRAETEGGPFTVSHPSLPTHTVKGPARVNLRYGACPVFYLNCTGEVGQYQLTERLHGNSFVRRHVDLGQSFGFDRTRILPNASWPAVRISAGAQTDTNALGVALKRALETL